MRKEFLPMNVVPWWGPLNAVSTPFSFPEFRVYPNPAGLYLPVGSLQWRAT